MKILPHPQAYGQWGEDRATDFLRRQGLQLLARHYQTRFGEIDLIVRDGDTIIFVEVKTRARINEPSAADAISFSKQKKMIGTALAYLKRYGLENENIRFDAILLEGGRLEWLQNVFYPTAYFTR